MWKKLPYRLLCVVVSTFLPLNLMAVIMAGIVIYSSSRQIQQSYQRGLITSMGRLEQGIEEIEVLMNSFMMDYLTELTLSEESDNMRSYEMLIRLSDEADKTELAGLIYLYDRAGEMIFVKCDNVDYPVRRVEDMKKQLIQRMPETQNGEWKVTEADGGYFLQRDYEYPSYQIGFLVDMEQSLEMILGEELKEDEIYFTDGADMVLFVRDGCLTEIEGKWESIFRRRLLSLNTVWEENEQGWKLGIQINNGSFLKMIPLFYWILLTLTLMSVLLVFTLWRMLQKRVVDPLHILQNAMQQLEQNNIDFRISAPQKGETEDFIYIYDTFNKMAGEIKSSHDKDIKMLRAQLDNLRLQVNPHMLLNSFNMIYSLAQTRNYACIQEFSMYLVEYFRYVLKENDSFVPLMKEMKFLESYVGIQKLRFPGAFTSVYNMQEESKEALVPPLLVQNFVENAMKYALIPGQTIEVLINIRKEEERLLISICDTGRGIKPEVLACIQNGEVYQDRMGHKHIGIWNCRRRMEVFYGGNTSMNIISTLGEGTQVWLDLPYLTAETL